MASAPPPRYGLVLGTLGVAAAAGMLALITLWALVVLPFAVIVGICAWRGMTVADTWQRRSEETGEDPGRGRAGLGL